MRAEIIISSGKVVDIFTEQGILSLTPTDIINGLEKRRYNGHRYYLAQNIDYSVLDHSIVMSDYLISLGEDFINASKLAVVHDFSECFIPDIPSPIKSIIKFTGEATIKEWENWVSRLWCQKLFGFTPEEHHINMVEELDKSIVHAEMAILFGKLPEGNDGVVKNLHEFLLKRLNLHTDVRRKRNSDIINILFNKNGR